MRHMTNARRRAGFGWATLLVWVGILLATLFPFQFRPHNDVLWMAAGGLQFGKHGIATSDGVLNSGPFRDDARCSLDILLRPASLTSLSGILTVSSEGHPWQIQVRQYRNGLVLWREWPPGQNRYRYTKKDIVQLRTTQTTLVTVASGPKGTAIYSNGQSAARFPGEPLSCRLLNGFLTLGTDPVRIDAWSGDILGVALYNVELSPDQITGNYQFWSHAAMNSCTPESGRTVLYTFREGQGTIVRNLCGGPGLLIPSFYQLPFKPFLAPPWKEFAPTLYYANDVLRNILGFVPFGFALCGYLSLSRKTRHVVRVSVLLGALTSLSIEILQGYLPQRESGITDLLTNTLGTFLGACMLQWNPLREYLGLLSETTVGAQTPSGENKRA